MFYVVKVGPPHFPVAGELVQRVCPAGVDRSV
jgi:hypothetical protein